MLWNDLEMDISICGKCHLEKIRKNPILGFGNKESKVIFIFENISEAEDAKEGLLLDEEGEYFKKFLEFSKYDFNEAYFTTLLKCSSHGEIVDENYYDRCNDYLMTQIALVNPKIIITVGEFVTKYFLKDEEIKDIREIVGKTYKYAGDIILVPIYDLAYLKKANDKEKWLLVNILKNIRKEVEEI